MKIVLAHRMYILEILLMNPIALRQMVRGDTALFDISGKVVIIDMITGRMVQGPCELPSHHIPRRDGILR